LEYSSEVLPMLKRPLRILLLACAPVLAAVVVAGPAAAERAYYAWRSDEGAYAFTDDPRAIPEAHRKQAERRALRSLRSYARLTPSDPRASSDYAQRLDARLAYLRERSQRLAAREAARTARRNGSAPAIALRTGGDDSPLLEITPVGAGGSDEPVIVETLRARPANRLVTRNNTVVRQGDRTLAIVRSRGREWNVNEDIHVESDLE
jgi:hypothetical protein